MRFDTRDLALVAIAVALWGLVLFGQNWVG